MCLGGAPSVPPDNSAAIAAQQQADKEANVAKGEAAINNIFGGPVTAPTTPAPANTSPITWIGGSDKKSFTPGSYYEANAPVSGRYAVYDATGALKGYTTAAPTESGSNQKPGGSFPTTTTQAPGQFDDAYYNKISKNYEDYYNPQLDTQYQNALNSLTLQLGQQGILSSSEGNRQIGLLNQNNQTQKATIANNALSQSQTARQAVAQERNALLAQNQTAANPSLAAETAAAGAQQVQSTPTYSPLGSVFAGLLGTGTNALSIQQGGLAGTNTGGGTFINPFSSTSALGQTSNTGGSTTGKVVN